ncbi:MAG: FKBP-type peptidyl-prolyl cis-trans isomerase [Thermoplasmata archaeon]
MKRWTTLIIIIIIAIAASGAGIYASGYFSEDEPDAEPVIEMGDAITVHYTGWLEDERIYEERRIFDTSRDHLPEKTTLTFDERVRDEPFQFTVGEGVIEGWSEYMVGMKEGETKHIIIPPEKAYDTRTTDLVFTIEREEKLPVYENISVSFFEERYGTSPSSYMVVTDHFWGWEKTVMSVEGDRVILRNDPEIGEHYNAYKQEGSGWRSKVTSVDSSTNNGIGEIHVRHLVEKGTIVNSNHIGMHNTDIAKVENTRIDAGQSQDHRGIVVDVCEDTITVDFNEEVAGKTLRFKVTVLEIQKQE